MTEGVKTWVIGAGGLVGSAIARTSSIRAFESAKIPWATADAQTMLRNELDRFVHWVGNDTWGIVWAAGVGVAHTDQTSLDLEIATFDAFCARTAEVFPRGQGGLYVISSAGGVCRRPSNAAAPSDCGIAFAMEPRLKAPMSSSWPRSSMPHCCMRAQPAQSIRLTSSRDPWGA